MSRPMDIRDWRSHEQAINCKRCRVVACGVIRRLDDVYGSVRADFKSLEASKVALKRHYDHMLEHRAELQEHMATVDEQISMVGPAMEAIDAQLAGYRGRSS
jgi:hypothetical protein